MAGHVCAICGKPIAEVIAWKHCDRYSGPVCMRHCIDTCKTLFGEHCIHSGARAPTATSPGKFEPKK